MANPRKVRDVANAEQVLEWDRGCGPSSLPSHFLHYLQLPRAALGPRRGCSVGSRDLCACVPTDRNQNGTARCILHDATFATVIAQPRSSCGSGYPGYVAEYPLAMAPGTARVAAVCV